MGLRVTRWRPLIRRSRLEAFLRVQAENCERDGLTQAAFALRQMAENLRTGISLSPTAALGGIGEEDE